MEEVSPYDTDERVRARIDKLLKEMSGIQATLGKNNTPKEIIAATRKIVNREHKIKDICPIFYKRIKPYPDED